VPADATAAPDAAPDAPPAIDDDHDGHPAEADCDDHDPAVWQDLAYGFRDADGDGRTVASAGTICSGASLPRGFLVAASLPDCDDTDPAVFDLVNGFIDLDRDGVGAGPLMAVCSNGTLPASFAATGTDCAPGDATAWQVLGYNFRDGDGDGAVIAQAGTQCSGARLPPGFFVDPPANRPFDCDDSDPAIAVPLTVFADADHDGFGAGASQLACTAAGAPPAGFSTSGTDCDDGDPAVWASLAYTAVDFDGDGVTAPASGTRCTSGTLAPPFFAAAHGHDCNDDDPALTRFVVLYPDHDGDGVGAPPRQIACIGDALPAGLVVGGYDVDDGDPAAIEDGDADDIFDLIVNS
ncbi:MAG TPA: hypothetical protein VFP84_29145, partial [Kofleriaceae bacterium]|nr:hypothetical protein [Kofleriaceae bacterium]